MPVLPPEPTVCPLDLFAADADPLTDQCWWAVHTRPRAEKSLARKVRGQGVSYFLPLHRTRPAAGRGPVAHLPLFPGYLFLFGDADARLRALETNLVASVLSVPDQRELADDLRRIHQVLTSGAPIRPEPELEPGAAVEITAGPLAGLRGRVLRRGPRPRLYVEVRLLRQGVSVEIESWMVERRAERDGVPAIPA
jgi:transcriptional antiterminator RfaH